MVSNVSFGQVATGVPAQQVQYAVQQPVYYTAAPTMGSDSYTSSNKKESHPFKKLLLTAAVVLGGSALATKMPAVKKAVEKMASNPGEATIIDKGLSYVNKFGTKVTEVATNLYNKAKNLVKKRGEEFSDISDGVDKINNANGKTKVKIRRAKDAYKNILCHDPNDVIQLGDGKNNIFGISTQLALPTPEQVAKTISKMSK